MHSIDFRNIHQKTTTKKQRAECLVIFHLPMEFIHLRDAFCDSVCVWRVLNRMAETKALECMTRPKEDTRKERQKMNYKCPMDLFTKAHAANSINNQNQMHCTAPPCCRLPAL